MVVHLHELTHPFLAELVIEVNAAAGRSVNVGPGPPEAIIQKGRCRSATVCKRPFLSEFLTLHAVFGIRIQRAEKAHAVVFAQLDKRKVGKAILFE